MRRLAFGLMVIGVTLGVRAVLLATGTLHTPGEARLSGLVVGAVCVATALLVVGRGSAAERDRRSPNDLIASVAGALALVTAGLGLSDLLAPTTPRDASAAACVGAPVSGGAFLATTGSDGANARSGPDESFPQVRRFDAHCTLAFDGYCVGQPEGDLKFSGLNDQRWLVVHRPWQGALSWVPWVDPPRYYVAGGVVQSQSPERALGRSPDSDCKADGAWAPPGKITARFEHAAGQQTLRASAKHAVAVGFATVLRDAQGDGNVRRTAGTNAAFQLDARSVATLDVAKAELHEGDQVVASVCLAPNVEQVGDIAVFDVQRGGRLRHAEQNKSRAPVNRIQTAACSTR